MGVEVFLLMLMILLIALQQPWYIVCIPLFIYVTGILFIVLLATGIIFFMVLKSSNKEECLKDIEDKLNSLENRSTNWF